MIKCVLIINQIRVHRRRLSLISGSYRGECGPHRRPGGGRGTQGGVWGAAPWHASAARLAPRFSACACGPSWGWALVPAPWGWGWWGGGWGVLSSILASGSEGQCGGLTLETPSGAAWDEPVPWGPGFHEANPWRYVSTDHRCLWGDAPRLSGLISRRGAPSPWPWPGALWAPRPGTEPSGVSPALEVPGTPRVSPSTGHIRVVRTLPVTPGRARGAGSADVRSRPAPACGRQADAHRKREDGLSWAESCFAVSTRRAATCAHLRQPDAGLALTSPAPASPRPPRPRRGKVWPGLAAPGTPDPASGPVHLGARPLADLLEARSGCSRRPLHPLHASAPASRRSRTPEASRASRPLAPLRWTHSPPGKSHVSDFHVQNAPANTGTSLNAFVSPARATEPRPAARAWAWATRPL